MMLEARKENKVYKIDETMKDRYLKEGFDVYNENGEIVEHTPLKKIKYSDHLKAIADKDKEISALKETVTTLQSQETTAENVTDLLKSYAKSKNIDIGSSTSANGILSKILEIEKV